jgi:rubrerythrin
VADSEEVIAMLNEDLTFEVEATLVYMHNHFVLTRACGTQLEVFDIALDEMRHIEWLSDAIVGLGGNPELTPHQLRFAPADNIEACKRGITLEQIAIDGYNAHIAAIADPKLQRMLAHIRDEEVDHLDEFKELLEEAEKANEDRQPTVGDMTGEPQA